MPLKSIIYKIKNSNNNNDNISLTQCSLLNEDAGLRFSVSFDLSLRNF